MSGNKPLNAVAGNLFARLYLAVCVLLLIWVAVDSTLVPHEDASFAGVVPLILTAPFSLVVLALPINGLAGVLLPIAAGAVVNAWLITRIGRATGSTRHRAGA
ncbi:SCO4225 family membrane protein [Streptomyces tsukubensis]|uniref:Uncharacterized protein n=1 Tax=Streptomyces tsukubensis TaxID=83656 RepID=A0A1V4AB93_9ACTN|nr:hypothetical protein [Streptomyces tsukubensis]OON80679.1 hypothetical protein B1H18_12520 [Streptomyces tsukubensis]QFR96343.1 hypothetical protein GBW32_29000 [Streptomyces tsukubensis]